MTNAAPNEIVTHVHIPQELRRWGFTEVARRSGDFALAGAIAKVMRLFRDDDTEAVMCCGNGRRKPAGFSTDHQDIARDRIGVHFFVALLCWKGERCRCHVAKVPIVRMGLNALLKGPSYCAYVAFDRAANHNKSCACYHFSYLLRGYLRLTISD